MKKKLAGVLAAVGAVILGIGLILKGKEIVSFSIIGASDGPTAVFYAGKLGDGFAWTGLAVGAVMLAVGLLLFFRAKKE